MKFIPKSNTDISSTKAQDPIELSDISVSRLIDDALLALYREIKNLLIMSARGKLEPNDARDLRDHLKMLFEIQAREASSLKGITDEELHEQVKAVLKPDGNI